MSPYNYEVLKKYIDLEKKRGNQIGVRRIFEKALEDLPFGRKEWTDYIYLWLDYAYFEEFEAKDIEKARGIYSRCTRLISRYGMFLFPEVWISAAKLEINESDFDKARTLLESGIEKSPAREIFQIYIEMEFKLGHVIRCQTLFMRYVQWSKDDDFCSWIEYTNFEKSQLNPNRARFIYDIAISQPALYKCRQLWDSYIDFEVSEGEFDKARELFEILLKRTKNVNVWIKYARFEAFMVKDVFHEKDVVKLDEKLKQNEEEIVDVETSIQRVRDIFRKGFDYFRSCEKPHVEEWARDILLKEWEILERGFGSFGDVNLVIEKASRLNRKNHGILLS
ncbi:hypothetical protein M9H77_06322 [Catharanthus roseus]|uniref:Uncharacterized protein n=1 Tax=Catharanthus roseus TaxID=4058 RepID=A0ACC0BS32_CATRO|nr:hypothetical protein M9H77_06322 [Catharanthus roseus]